MGVSDSANLIRSIQFSYSGFGTGDRIGIDDIVFATTNSVPEPTVLLLMAIGIAGFGFSRRKKAI